MDFMLSVSLLNRHSWTSCSHFRQCALSAGHSNMLWICVCRRQGKVLQSRHAAVLGTMQNCTASSSFVAAVICSLSFVLLFSPAGETSTSSCPFVVIFLNWLWTLPPTLSWFCHGITHLVQLANLCCWSCTAFLAFELVVYSLLKCKLQALSNVRASIAGES